MVHTYYIFCSDIVEFYFLKWLATVMDIHIYGPHIPIVGIKSNV